jgi:hypothetical protein
LKLRRKWVRYIAGIGDELAAVQESGKEPLAKFEFDEFGNKKTGSAGRSGWLGGKQRRTELPSGVIQMGRGAMCRRWGGSSALIQFLGDRLMHMITSIRTQ